MLVNQVFLKNVSSFPLISDLKVNNIQFYCRSDEHLNNFKMDSDCGTDICHTEFKILPTCHLRVSTPNTNCSIPCNLKPCNVEIHHYIRCPVISCYPKSSTTTPIPTTSIRPTAAPLNPTCTSPICITSVSFNALFLILLALGSFFGFRFYKRQTRRQNYQELANVEAFGRNENSSILRGFSNVDLATPPNESLQPNQSSSTTNHFATLRKIFQRRTVPQNPDQSSNSSQETSV